MTGAAAEAKAGWSSRPGLVALAVGYQWFGNGANFLAFKVSGDALHPLLVGALRFLVAGALLLPFALARARRGRVEPGRLANAASLGVLMLVAGQGLAIWGTHFLPAGVASVFGSAIPIFLAIFAWAVFGRALTRRRVAGVSVGFTGLALMAWSSATSGGFSWRGAAMSLAACACWAFGSLLSPRLRLPDDRVVDLAAQTLTAGLVLATVAALSGIAGGARWAEVSAAAWGGIAFLTIASTLVGYAVFTALNAATSATLANSFNYVAPVIALGLSALVLHEPLTVTKVVAGAVTLSGVALMIGGEKQERR